LNAKSSKERLSKQNNEYTERITKGEITYAGLQEHINRYVFASRFGVQNKIVLDVSCGIGYGSSYLAEAGSKLMVGADLSLDAIKHAKEDYSLKNLAFVCCDAQNLPFKNNSFDVIVSMETIEHLTRPAAFLSNVRHVLKNDGFFLCSTPNRVVVSPPLTTKPLDRFHVREFYARDFYETLNGFFERVYLLGQSYLNIFFLLLRIVVNVLSTCTIGVRIKECMKSRFFLISFTVPSARVKFAGQIKIIKMDNRYRVMPTNKCPLRVPSHYIAVAMNRDTMISEKKENFHSRFWDKSEVASTRKGVLIVSHVQYPFYAGVSRRIHGYEATLRDAGFLVRIVSPSFQRSDPVKIGENNIKYVHLEWLGKFLDRSFIVRIIAYLLFSIPSFVEMVKRKAFFAVVQYEQLSSLPGALMAKLFLRKKLVADDFVLSHALEQNWFKRRLLYFLDCFAINVSDLLITALPAVHAIVRKNFRNKEVMFVPNGVLSSTISSSDPRVSEKKLLLFVAWLYNYTALEAIRNIFAVAARLRLTRSDFKFLIAGGPLDKVKEMVHEPTVKQGVVKFLGFVPDEQLNTLYQRSYIGLLPYFDLPSGYLSMTKAVEYMTHGLLVISSKKAVESFDLKPGVHYVKVESEDELYEALEKCLDVPSLYEPIRNCGWRHITREFSWKKLLKPYIETLHRVQKYS